GVTHVTRESLYVAAGGFVQLVGGFGQDLLAAPTDVKRGRAQLEEALAHALAQAGGPAGDQNSLVCQKIFLEQQFDLCPQMGQQSYHLNIGTLLRIQECKVEKDTKQKKKRLRRASSLLKATGGLETEAHPEADAARELPQVRLPVF